MKLTVLWGRQIIKEEVKVRVYVRWLIRAVEKDKTRRGWKGLQFLRTVVRESFTDGVTFIETRRYGSENVRYLGKAVHRRPVELGQ